MPYWHVKFSGIGWPNLWEETLGKQGWGKEPSVGLLTQKDRFERRRWLHWLVRSQGSRHFGIQVARASLVGTLIVVSALIVYAAGGTKTVYPHLFYIPVVLSAYYFGIAGAVVTAVVSGLATGPVMPLDRAGGLDQRTISWLYRLGFLTSVGVFTALLLQSQKRLSTRASRTADELYHAYGKCLTTFASLVSMRDEPTAYHCERVAENATIVGAAVGLSEQELKELYWEGILHDLGKVATPAHILLKPGPLTSAEYDEIKKHAKLGADILVSISPRFRPLADGIRSHHERWDGSGYPDRLAGEDIPLNGRILAVVDVFEALTSDRPYRDALTTPEALEVIREGIGTHFDPELAQCFLDLCSQGKILVQGDPVPSGGSHTHAIPGYSVLSPDSM